MQFPATAIKQEAASDLVVSQLLAMVKAGTLKPGDRLPCERDMAEMFKVSRPTVREGVRALAVLGVLKVRHGSGIFVSGLEAKEILGPLSFFLTLHDVQVEQLYDARRLIEGEIASLAARNATPGDIVELRQLIAEQEQRIGDPHAYRESDGSFHRKLAQIASNPFLARAAESLGVLGLEFRKTASETPAVLESSIRDHDVIVDCIAAEDTDGARIGMQAHMMNVLRSTKAAAALTLAATRK